MLILLFTLKTYCLLNKNAYSPLNFKTLKSSKVLCCEVTILFYFILGVF